MRTVGLVFGFAQSALLVSAASGPAQALAFDCAKARLAAEKMICKSDPLKALDARMEGLYFQLRTSQPKEGKAKLLQEQRAWLASRNRCIVDTACLEQRYRSRIEALEKALQASDAKATRAEQTSSAIVNPAASTKPVELMVNGVPVKYLEVGFTSGPFAPGGPKAASLDTLNKELKRRILSYACDEGNPSAPPSSSAASASSGSSAGQPRAVDAELTLEVALRAVTDAVVAYEFQGSAYCPGFAHPNHMHYGLSWSLDRALEYGIEGLLPETVSKETALRDLRKAFTKAAVDQECKDVFSEIEFTDLSVVVLPRSVRVLPQLPHAATACAEPLDLPQREPSAAKPGPSIAWPLP